MFSVLEILGDWVIGQFRLRCRGALPLMVLSNDLR